MITDPALMEILLDRVAAWRRDRLFVLGISGPQGSGKSTLAADLAARLSAQGLRTAVLSLDDLYRTHAERQQLADSVHPLLATRGVPGTHDTALGLAVLDALKQGEPCCLPRFSKALDDRLPQADWPCAPADTNVLLFEGWCLGAVPQDAAALAAPINRLERAEDPLGVWRRHANAALADPYAALFARIDRLIYLRAPDWASVLRWREQQEDVLRARAPSQAPGVMDRPGLSRFMQHYERITRAMQATLCSSADITISLDSQRRPTLPGSQR